MYGRLKRKERKKLSKLILFFLPMVLTFSQLQDHFKISCTPFPNVLNRINLLSRGPASTLTSSTENLMLGFACSQIALPCAVWAVWMSAASGAALPRSQPLSQNVAGRFALLSLPCHWIGTSGGRGESRGKKEDWNQQWSIWDAAQHSLKKVILLVLAGRMIWVKMM